MERKSYKSFHQLITENRSVFKLFRKSKNKGIMKAIWDVRQGDIEYLSREVKVKTRAIRKKDKQLKEEKSVNKSLFDNTMELLGDLDDSREQVNILTRAIDINQQEQDTLEKDLNQYLLDIKKLELKLGHNKDEKHYLVSKNENLILKEKAEVIHWRKKENHRSKQILGLTKKVHGLLQCLKKKDLILDVFKTTISQKNFDVSKIEIQLERKNAEISRLKDRIKQLKKYSREELLIKMEAFAAQNHALNKEIKKIAIERELIKKIDLYKEKAREGINQRKKYTLLSKDIRQKNHILHLQINNLKSKLSDSDMIINDLHHEKEMLIKENRMLKNDLAEKDSNLRQFKKINFKMSNELTKLSEQQMSQF